MATEVSICSNALVSLGDRPISSFDDATDSALAASNLYPDARNALLRSHPWNCCIKRVVLAPNVAAPTFSYAYAFLLPSDWIRTLAVGEDGYEVDHRMEGRNVLCNDAALSLRYVYRNEDPASWDASLVKAMTLAMKAELAYAITKSQSVADSAKAELQAFLKQARAVDGQDNPPETLGDFPLLAARY